MCRTLLKSKFINHRQLQGHFYVISEINAKQAFLKAVLMYQIKSKLKVMKLCIHFASATISESQNYY